MPFDISLSSLPDIRKRNVWLPMVICLVTQLLIRLFRWYLGIKSLEGRDVGTFTFVGLVTFILSSIGTLLALGVEWRC